MRSRTRSTLGFTIFEVLLSTALASLIVAGVAQVFVSSDELVKDSRVTLRAQEMLRRNLEAVSNVLRDVDVDTLGNFSGGVATQPTFRRVTGADALGRTHGGVERILWQPAPSVDGITAPGRLMHLADGRYTLLADRVPQNGFRVLLQGNRLVVELKTYWSAAPDDVVTVDGRTAVSLRN